MGQTVRGGCGKRTGAERREREPEKDEGASANEAARRGNERMRAPARDRDPHVMKSYWLAQLGRAFADSQTWRTIMFFTVPWPPNVVPEPA